MNLVADDAEGQARIAAFLQGLQQLGWTDGGNVRVDYRLAAGFVQSLARPGGNTTGFMQFEFGLPGKWLELLKQVAPDVTRAAVLRDPDVGSGTTQFAVIQAMAPLLKVEVNQVNVRDPSEITRAVEAFARSPNGGLIVTASGLAVRHRELIITMAARHKLPAVYFDRPFVIWPGGVSEAGHD